MTATKNVTIVLGFAAMYLIWGSTFLAIRFGLESFPPFLMAGVRFLIAGGLFFAWGYRRRRTPLSARHWVTSGVLGVLMIAAANGLVTWAEKTVPSGITGLLWGLFPLLLAAFEWSRPGRSRPSIASLGAMAAGFVGVALLIKPVAGGASSFDPFGTALVVIAVVSWTVGTIFAKDTDQPRPAVLASGMQMLVGSAVMIVVALARGELTAFEPARVSYLSLGAFAYLVLIGSAAFPLYFWLLRVTSTSKVATEAYVCPVIALILGAAFAGESLTSGNVLSAALVLAGVVGMVTEKERHHATGKRLPSMEVT